MNSALSKWVRQVNSAGYAGGVSEALWDRSRCSVAGTLAVVGEKWSLLVLREAFLGVRRFADFQRMLGAPRAVLTDRLTTLVDQGILRRGPYPGGGGGPAPGAEPGRPAPPRRPRAPQSTPSARRPAVTVAAARTGTSRCARRHS